MKTLPIALVEFERPTNRVKSETKINDCFSGFAFLRSPGITRLLGVLLCFLFSGLPLEARNPDISKWISNLSSTPVLEPSEIGPWSDEYSNLAVSGNTVHSLWYSSRFDGDTRTRFVYRRSTNSGSSWSEPIVIAKDSDIVGGSLVSDASARFLCVTGSTVHIVIVRSFGGGDWAYNICYYRSIDNGATFEPERVILNGTKIWHIGRPRIVGNDKRIVIGYQTSANWYSNYHINLLVSSDNGTNFRNVAVVGSSERDGGFEDIALSGTDVHVLYYHLSEAYYYGNFQARIGVASSRNDCASFNSNSLSTAATDGRYYALGTKDSYNSPDLVVSGTNVHVLWNQLDTNYNGTKTLRYARSTDRGETFQLPITMHKEGTLYPGQETIAAKGNYVYVLFPTTDSKIRLRRSVNGGATFSAVQNLSEEGGWWPQIGLDPRDATGADVYAFWDAPTYRHSTDGGVTFGMQLWAYPIFSYNRLHRSQLVIQRDGSLHTTTNGFFYSAALGGICDWDTFYHRLTPQPDPSGSKIGLRLITLGASFEDRADNFQAVPKTLNFKKAMTAEVWVKDMEGGIGTGYSDYRTPIFFKQTNHSTGYSPAYGLGTVASNAGRKIVADITTTAGFSALIADGDVGVLKPQTWTHLAMSYDSSVALDNFKLYQNGELIAKSTLTGMINSGFGNLFVGRYGNWVVDDLRFWNRALDEGAIRTNMGRAITGSEPDLSAYYSFDNTAKDLTGNGNDGIFMYHESYTKGAVFYQELQTITFAALSRSQMGDGVITLNATASSGLPVTYISSNPRVAKVINDNQIRILGAGRAIITANQKGDNTWLAAQPVDRTLTVDKGEQIIHFSTLPKRPFRSGEKFELNGSTTSKLTIRYTSSMPRVISVEGNIATVHRKGTAILTASQGGNDDWLPATPVARTVKVQ
jgi:hypothetical protein